MAPRTCAQGSKRAARDTARFSMAQLELLAEAGRRLNGPLDLSSVLARVSAFFVPRIADWYVLALTQADGHMRALAYQHREPARRVGLGTLAASTLFDRPQTSAMARAGGGTLGWLPRVAGDDWNAAREVCGWSEKDLAQLGTGSVICLPLTHAAEAFGAILLAREAEDVYDSTTVEVAAEIIQRVGVMVANACGYEALQEELHQVNEALAVAAHELRTPATALRGIAQLLLRQYERGGEIDAEEVRSSLSRLDHQAIRLATMVDRLMDAACVDTGKLSVVRVDAELREIVMNVVELARSSHSERCLTVDAPRAIEARLDALRIEQVLSNLIDNALKFSPSEAPVEITLRQPHPGSAIIAVRDHGVGVPVERRGQIFDRFVQAHRDQAPAGLGLGLYLSQCIVEQHGGRLTAEYPTDGGARFVVELPVLDTILPEKRTSEDDEHGGPSHDTARAQSDWSARGRTGRPAGHLRSPRLHRAPGVSGSVTTCVSA
jgi:signal transduction histidine kinase